MKKHQIKSSLLLVAILFTSTLFAQDWAKMMQDPEANFFETQKAFNKYSSEYVASYRQAHGKDPAKVPGEKIFRRWEWFMAPRVSQTGERFSPDAAWNAMSEYKKGYDKPMAGNWTSLGPNTPSGIAGIGRLNAIRVHPTNPSTIYVCAPSGGLWKSTDDGATWSTNTDQHQVIGCSDLAFDPTNPNTMYLATGDVDGGDNYSVGLLKSTDGGTTWNTTGLNFNLTGYIQIARVLVDPTNTNNIIVATSSGIYRSTNAAATFTKATNTAPPQADLAGNFKDMEFKPGTPSTMYACGTEFFRSTNGGATWTKATGSLPAAAAVQRMAIAVTAADPNVVYLVAMKATTYDMEGVYKSTNSGSSFPAKISAPGIGNQGFYDLCIAANPTNANEVMLGGQTEFLRNQAGGTGSWSNVIGTMHVDFHDVIYTSGTTAYVCSDGGVWKSTNNGGSWTDKSAGLTISQLYGFGQSATNANLILGGWQDNGTNAWNGSSWNYEMGGDGMLAFISKGNDNNMWGSQYNGSLKRSTPTINGGAWTGISGITQSSTEVCPWVTEWNEDPSGNGTVYAGCSNVWKATLTGNFVKLGTVASGTVTITAIGVSPANTQIIWTAKGGTLYKSINGGTSWTAVTGLPAGTITDIQCHPTDANKAWITYSGFSNVNKVFQTTNGSTWTNISASLPNIPVNCMTIDKNGNDALYVGTDIGVFFKDASMTVWQPFSTGLPRVVVSQLDIVYSSPAKIRASTYGRGVWESGLYSGTYAPDANFAGNVLIGCPGLGVQFSDYSSGQPTSWSWTFPGGNPPTSTAQNPFVAYNTTGTYAVTLTATNSLNSDSQTFTGYISISSAQAPPTPAFTTTTICGPAPVTLSATSPNNGTVRWWTQPSGGTLIGSDNTSPYSISPNLFGTQTVYVDQSFPGGNLDIVASDNSMGGGAVFTANDIRGLYFDVLKPIVINNVKVYSGSAGMRTIEILDANGNLVTDTTLNVAQSGTITPTTVNINRTVYPGSNYFIKFRGKVDAFRNSDGASYPYTDGGSNSVNITNSNAGSPGYYYFFYDWQVTPIVCNTGRVAISITDNCSLTGVEDVFASNLLNIYPNPNNGEFTLSFHTEKTDNYSVKITNTIGQVVYEEALNNFSGDYSKQLDISTFNKGVYMLSVSNSKNETVKKVLVH